MPYLGPQTAAPPRPRNHRRSASFTDEQGPGAFVSLGALPKLHRKKLPTFHFRNDDDDDSPEEDNHRLSIDTAHLPPAPPPAAAVPFPASSPTSGTDTPQLTADSSPAALLSPHRRPILTRGSSTPILLSNGKPLKSSLKSSASAPALPEDSLYPPPARDARSMHLRAQSAPTTPFLAQSQSQSQLVQPKNVHFPEKKEDGLEDIRVFSRKARPTSVSLAPGQGLGDDTETETEQESSSRFPFPRFTAPPAFAPATATLAAPALSAASFPGAAAHGPLKFEIDYTTPHATAPVPAAHPPAHANIHLESIALAQPPAPAPPAHAPQLTGTLLVRNVAYEKHVAVRFTLDEWQTTSEVRAHHVASVPALPWEAPAAAAARTLGDAVSAIASASKAGEWDRFAFNIRLEDHACKLHERVLWLVGRYSTGGDGGEWWDNNEGSNYRVGFLGRVPEPAPAPKLPTADFGLGFDFPTAISLSPASAYIPPPAAPAHAHAPAGIAFHPTSAPRSPGMGARRGHGLNLLNYAAPAPGKQSGGSSPSQTPLRTPVPPLPAAPLAPITNAAPARRPSPPSPPRRPEGPVPGWNWSSPSSSLSGTPTGGAYKAGAGPHWTWGPGAEGAHGSGRNGNAHGSAAPRALFPGSGIHSPTRRSPVGSGASTPSPFSPTSAAAAAHPFGALGAENSSSEELYNAFVKQWCFAQSPAAAPGVRGAEGNGKGKGGAEVLVG